eukprot:4962695-Karenia_brevis.AAC.1
MNSRIDRLETLLVCQPNPSVDKVLEELLIQASPDQMKRRQGLHPQQFDIYSDDDNAEASCNSTPQTGAQKK